MPVVNRTTLKRLALLAAVTSTLFASKNPHPRLLGVAGPGLGAPDGSTVGSMRWKAAQNTADWQKFCSYLNSWYVSYNPTTGNPSLLQNAQSNWEYVDSLGLGYLILNGFTGTQSSCTYSAAQYGATGVAAGDAIVAYLANNRCSGSTCNGTSKPPYYGNDMRNEVPWFALAYDYLYPLLDQKTTWEQYLEWCGNAFISPSGYGTYGLHQGYDEGVGPAENGHTGMWFGLGLVGYATYGDNSTDGTSGCVEGETQCNAETTAFLTDFYNNDIPWWTLQSSQQNAYPTLNSCQGVLSTGNVLGNPAGGAGCGVGGFPGDGVEYGPQTQLYLIVAVDLVSSADSAVNLWSAMPSYFPSDQANQLISNLSPESTTEAGGYEWINYGDQQSGSQFSPNPALHGSALILGAYFGSAALGSYMRYYSQNLVGCMVTLPCSSNNNKPMYYFDLMYGDDTGMAVTNPVGNVPLDYWAIGEQFLVFRSDATANALWGAFVNKELGGNHEHAIDGAAKIMYKGQWVLLDAVGYGPPYTNTNTQNIPTYQGPNEAGGGGIWKGTNAGTGNGQPSFIAAEIDPQGRFDRVWFDMTQEYRRTSGFATVHTSSAVFSGSGTNDLSTYYAANVGPGTAGTEWHYNVQIDSTSPGNGLAYDTFEWNLNGGVYTTGVPIVTGSNITLNNGIPVRFTQTTGHTGGEIWDFYSDNWGDWLNVQKIQREAIYVKRPQPYFVILDRAQFRDSTNLRSQWNFPNTTFPTYSGGIIQSTNNGESIFIQPVYSSNGTSVALQDLATIPSVFSTQRSLLGPDYTSTTFYPKGIPWAEATVSTTTGATTQVLVHTMQVGDSTTNPTAAESVTASGIIAAHMKDATQDQVVAFSSDSGGALIGLSSPVSYTYTRAASAAQNLVSDLPASTSVKVQITRNGQSSTVQIANASGAGTPYTTTAQGSLVFLDAASGALSITSSSPAPNGVVNLSYSYTLQASGGTAPYTWSITSGSLPGGLSLASSTGVISGLPSASGTASFTVTVTDSATPTPNAVSEAFSLAIAPALSITNSSPLPSGTTSIAYSAALATTGGNGAYTWSITSGSLPAGLSMSAGGVISGTPTGSGTSNFTVGVSDSTTPTPATASKAFSLTINTGSAGGSSSANSGLKGAVVVH